MNHHSSKRVPVKKLMTIGVISVLIIVGFAVAGAYYEHSTNNQKSLAKINKQIKELPELEEDIFTKCMEENKGGVENIPFCQENTQKQMHTLAQDLVNAKEDIESRKWYEFIKV